ncbi:MAG: DUF4293 family protein [Flavobacteriales bacterium]|nr:DUF4293 family protein [Flavobacteriales bacterium]
MTKCKDNKKRAYYVFFCINMSCGNKDENHLARNADFCNFVLKEKDMIIQRPQNLYFLLCAGMSCAGVSRFLPAQFAWEPVSLMLMIAGVLSLLSIFLFKYLKAQLVASRVVFIIIAIVFVLIIYRQLNLSGGAQSPEKGIEVWGLISTFLALLMSFLARKGVKKDIRLVKSADRLR